MRTQTLFPTTALEPEREEIGPHPITLVERLAWSGAIVSGMLALAGMWIAVRFIAEHFLPSALVRGCIYVLGHFG